MAPRRGWCKLCQDDYKSGDSIIKCTSCPKSYHRECLEHDISTNVGHNAELVDGHYDFRTFQCDNCLRYEDENVIENDDRCKLCKEKNRNDNDVLLLCDGCPNSYHIRCLELVAEPDGDQWFCPMCKPDNFQVVSFRKKQHPLADTGDHVNSSICYVCQRHGKLLGCDFCSNSFHHGCLPEFDVGTIGDVWECPCCKGQDPFINQMHKRWTVQQIDRNLKERRRCIQMWKAKITKYRNRFLLAHRNDLAPFVTDKCMESLKRNFVDEGSTARKRLLNSGRNIDDILEYFEEEAIHEAEKFVAKAHKSSLYPSGRKIDGRPLRNGVQLKPHQEFGVDWLLKSFLTGGAILSDEMGLGKTIQTLCFLSYLKLMKIEGPHLIVVPLSTVGNWLREIHRFTPHLTSIKICGSRTERQHAMEDRLAYKGLYDLYITTYETVKSEEEFFVETIPRWQCLILDEAHRIKNQSGAARHSMDRILANMRLLLTGTPLQNNAMELFTLINFMFPDIFKDTTLMDEVFRNVPRKHGRGAMSAAALAVASANTNFSKEDLESIKTLLSRVMLRRLKEEAITLHPKVFHDVWIPLSKVSLHWYRTLMSVRTLMKDQFSVKKLLGMVIKMRIICGHPRGIVSRTHQTEKLYDFFKQQSSRLQKQIEDDANSLRELRDKEHCDASAKLTFLDKLLCQLHYENCEHVQGYLEQFGKHLKEREMVREHKLKLRKKMKGVASQEPFEIDSNDFLVRTPAPTSRNPNFMVQGMYAEPMPEECPYKPESPTGPFAGSNKAVEGAKENAHANPDLKMSGAKNRVLDDEDLPDNVKVETEPSKGDNVHLIKSEKEVTIKKEADIDDSDVINSARDPKGAMMHKVLVFTQFQLVLDELEVYCNARGWKYMRLDGSTNKLIRELDIREFNSPSSPYFVYLISTRAGGLGINLTAANHVVLFDEDWNPFIDLQAIDRAHRIGQKRSVHIWKVVSEWTVEERMALCREKKLHLDKLLINSQRQAMDYEEAAEATTVSLSSAAIVNMMMHGNNALKNTEGEDITEMYLDDIIARGRKKPPEGLDDSAEIDESEDVTLEDDKADPNMVNVSDVMKEEDVGDEQIGDEETNTGGSSDEEEDSNPQEVAAKSPTVLDPKQVKKLLSGVKDKSEIVRQLESGGLLWRSGREKKRPSSMYVPDSFRKRSETRTLRHECRCFCCGFAKNHKAQYKDKDGNMVDIDYGELIKCFRCPKVYHKVCESLSDTRKTWTCRWHECCLCFRKSSQCDNMLIHCSNCPTSFCYDCFPPDYTRHYVGEDYYYALNQRGLNATTNTWIFFLCSKCKILQEKDRRKRMSKEDRELQQKQQREFRKQLATTDIGDDKNAKRRRRENRISFLDNYRAMEVQFENRLRTAYERLCPPNLIEEVTRRIEAARAKRDAEEAAGLVRLRREVNFLAIRLPYKMLAVCENCKLPLHNTVRYPGECPYVKEVIKLEVTVPVETQGTDDKVEQQAGKTIKKTACSKCLLAMTGKLSHTRRSCDLLTDEEINEYDDRRKRAIAAIEMLESLGISEPNEINYSLIAHPRLKAIYATALEDMDRIVLECFNSAGLNIAPVNGFIHPNLASASAPASPDAGYNASAQTSAGVTPIANSPLLSSTQVDLTESRNREMQPEKMITRGRRKVSAAIYSDSPQQHSATTSYESDGTGLTMPTTSDSVPPLELGPGIYLEGLNVAIPKLRQLSGEDTETHSRRNSGDSASSKKMDYDIREYFTFNK
ncbi:SNF2 family N-terminal domain containing protein [Babesia bovis T2Bo]|uniref:SNF2 family N-terminal domain containing protein n=1 Tax=Babesia bovis TaxID=5865 RepID=A7ANX1_BABBO|nr:SNF2 family N-terminal domain containing protein [Babesia bovis T2Bo]EDO08255.1 SNF2 family N-terminal domain containing protein [Babesia bovis T2Bo]|eukprot:XP_001611823.1 SNF2 family N-terminal domain containing protein [Babesia bovis T2Bo]